MAPPPAVLTVTPSLSTSSHTRGLLAAGRQIRHCQHAATHTGQSFLQTRFNERTPNRQSGARRRRKRKGRNATGQGLCSSRPGRTPQRHHPPGGRWEVPQQQAALVCLGAPSLSLAARQESAWRPRVTLQCTEPGPALARLPQGHCAPGASTDAPRQVKGAPQGLSRGRSRAGAAVGADREDAHRLAPASSHAPHTGRGGEGAREPLRRQWENVTHEPWSTREERKLLLCTENILSAAVLFKYEGLGYPGTRRSPTQGASSWEDLPCRKVPFHAVALAPVAGPEFKSAEDPRATFCGGAAFVPAAAAGAHSWILPR